MTSVETHEAMQQLGARFASRLVPGDLVILSGPLGAGKTTFVQGIARGLGVTERVTSPTFVIARVHETSRVPLIHVDAYRMSSLAELDDLGIDEDLAECITVVEWGHGVVDHWHTAPILIGIARHDESDVRTVIGA